MIRTACVVLLLVAAAGCGGGSSSDKAATKPSSSPSSTPSLSASPSPSGVAPNIGDTALHLGQTRHGTDIDTTVFQVRQPAAAPSFAQPEKRGDHWMIVRAKQCVHASASQAYDTDWDSYVGLDDDGGRFQASSDNWDTWPPLPQYPRVVKISPGSCVKGWMGFEMGKGQAATKIGLDAGDGSLAAEWLIN